MHRALEHYGFHGLVSFDFVSLFGIASGRLFFLTERIPNCALQRILIFWQLAFLLRF